MSHAANPAKHACTSRHWRCHMKASPIALNTFRETRDYHSVKTPLAMTLRI